ncbi:MAG: cell envelope integrity protein TolA [Pseudomonadota bacterium]
MDVADRLEFGPRREPGAASAFTFALLAHLLLAGALTWGVNWKRNVPDVAFEAELWSSVPREAAPPPPPPAAVVPPPPAPTPAPTPAPAPVPVKPAPAPPAPPKVDIALEQEKKRLQLKKLAEEKAAEDKKKAIELAQKVEAEKAKAKKAQEVAQAKAKADAEAVAKKQELAKAEDAKRKAAEAEAAQARIRKEQLDRMMGLAGATGAQGNAAQSAGPSASYGGRVRAKVRPNVVFTEDIAGNPTAEVEVRTTLDGTITSQRLVKSSGNKAWDDAVIKAIIRTETLPRDVDGRVPTPLIISFRPKD